MHRLVSRRLGIVLAAFALLAPTWASAAGDVEVSLAAHRVTLQKNGQESLAPADQAKPGDVVEYRATYANTGSRPVKGLAATLPIPAGMEFVPGTASPAGALASLDGTTFAPVPLQRRVRLADGTEVERDVPPAEYRWLRWPLDALGGNASRTVRARVRVAPLEVPAAAPR